MTPARKLTLTEVAALAGVSYQTIRIYRVRGSVPAPDGFDGQSPWWNPETIGQWLRDRPERGRPRKAP